MKIELDSNNLYIFYMTEPKLCHGDDLIDCPQGMVCKHNQESGSYCEGKC